MVLLYTVLWLIGSSGYEECELGANGEEFNWKCWDSVTFLAQISFQQFIATIYYQTVPNASGLKDLLLMARFSSLFKMRSGLIEDHIRKVLLSAFIWYFLLLVLGCFSFFHSFLVWILITCNRTQLFFLFCSQNFPESLEFPLCSFCTHSHLHTKIVRGAKMGDSPTLLALCCQ